MKHYLHEIYTQGDGVYLYKRGYEGEPILLEQD
jgi:hypothetical protein